MIINETIKLAIQEQNQLLDQKMKELRGTEPLHFAMELMIKPTQPINLAAEQEKLRSEIDSMASYHRTLMGRRSQLQPTEVPPEWPPGFMFMHDRIFSVEQYVENIDPDIVQNVLVNWWEDDQVKYIDKEMFMTEVDCLIQQWNGTAELFDELERAF